VEPGTIWRRILLAVDGSEQSLEAVRYIAGIIPPDKTEIVLFYVGTEFPEVFWEMDRNPLYRAKRSKVMGWLADQQVGIGEFKEVALHIFSDAGFSEDSVRMKTQTKKTDVARDIIQESYQNYSAVVVGRTGISRLKELLIGSITAKLVRKIKHVPIVVVGGRPRTGKILIALDKSIEAMRSVNKVGVLAGARDLDVTLLHVLRLPGMFRVSPGRLPATDREQDWLEYSKHKFKPCMDEATRRLAEAGISSSRIIRKFLPSKGNPVPRAIEEAKKGNYGTIVVGQREVISFIEEFVLGRFSHKVVSMADNLAVWVVS